MTALKFIIVNLCLFFGCIHADELFEKISNETLTHKKYLCDLGFQERAKGINVSYYQDGEIDPNMDLSIFEKRAPIPSEVIAFDPQVKNTLISTNPHVEGNDPDELRNILDIRLYPTLRQLIKDHKLEVFLGTSQEMSAYYGLKGWKIFIQFDIPSTATYYLAKDAHNHLIVIMSGLVSRENIIAQFLTLKLATISFDNIEIIGTPDHFEEIVKQDIQTISRKIPAVLQGNQILIIAGCDLKKKVSDLICGQYKDAISHSASFDGNILSLTHISLKQPLNGISGFIVLNLAYGEIMEPLVTQCLEQFHCPYLFSSGAGGYIPSNASQPLPTIGTWIPITKCIHASGEKVSLGSEDFSPSETHLQIPSIFLETYEWLHSAQTRGSSVDVETFYILRAVRNYNHMHPHNSVEAKCGCFVSDYVGIQALRDYSKVYEHYPSILTNFLSDILSSSLPYPQKASL